MSQIKITTKDKETYTLEYTRRTVKIMAQNGFNINSVSETPVIGIPALFEGAFYANHRQLSASEIEKIYYSISNKEGLIQKLVEMYLEPVNALIKEPDDESGNSKWEVI